MIIRFMMTLRCDCFIIMLGQLVECKVFSIYCVIYYNISTIMLEMGPFTMLHLRN